MASNVDVGAGRGALRERIVDHLRADIIEGRLAPGTQLRTEEIMTRFGVSNSPLREAFAQLAAEGLVEVHRNRGAYVASLTRDSAADLLRVNGLLWETAYRWSIPRLTPGDVSTLRRTAADFELAVGSGDHATALLAAEGFQRLMAETCGSAELIRSLAASGPRLRRLFRLFPIADRLDAHTKLHATTVQAARGKDADVAVDALREFWQRMENAVEDVPLEQIAP